MPVVERFGAGRPVLVVHGSPGDRGTWSRVVRFKLEGVSLWILELPGHGNQRLGTGGLDVYVRDLQSALIEAGDGVVLGGLSVGGYLVLRVLAETPVRVAKVVVCAGMHGLPIEGVAWRRGVARDLRAGALDATAVHASLIDGLVPSSSRTAEIERLIDPTLRGETAERLATLAERAAEIGGDDARLGPYETPAVILHGKDDPLVPVSEAEALVALGARAELHVIDTASHMLPITHPEEVARYLFA